MNGTPLMHVPLPFLVLMPPVKYVCVLTVDMRFPLQPVRADVG